VGQGATIMVGGLRQPTKGLFMNVNDTDAVPTYLGRGDPAGRPLGCLHLITFNADGQAQHIAAHYRPLSSLMFFSRLLRERLAETPYAEGFLDGEA
jgi:hypothetical protein